MIARSNLTSSLWSIARCCSIGPTNVRWIMRTCDAHELSRCWTRSISHWSCCSAQRFWSSSSLRMQRSQSALKRGSSRERWLLELGEDALEGKSVARGTDPGAIVDRLLLSDGWTNMSSVSSFSASPTSCECSTTAFTEGVFAIDHRLGCVNTNRPLPPLSPPPSSFPVLPPPPPPPPPSPA